MNTTPTLYGKPLSIGDTLWVREKSWRKKDNKPFVQATVQGFTDKGTVRLNYQGETCLLVTPRSEEAHLRTKHDFKVYLTQNQVEYFKALRELEQTISDRRYELKRLLADDDTTAEALFATATDDFREATAILSSED